MDQSLNRGWSWISGNSAESTIRDVVGGARFLLGHGWQLGIDTIRMIGLKIRNEMSVGMNNQRFRRMKTMVPAHIDRRTEFGSGMALETPNPM